IPARAEPESPVDAGDREAIQSFFDGAYYLAANPDVHAAGVDAMEHFLLQGWREGRAPNPQFDVDYYLRANQDVAAAGMNPALHFIHAGRAEGRSPRRPLDAARRQIEAAAS